MYIPGLNRLEEQEQVFALIEANSFATVVTSDQAGTPFATHMPVMLDRSRGPNGMLISHLARANPQWRHFVDVEEILVIFNGPHSYISPSWYAGEYNVPTWNYMAVHAYGKPNIVEEATILQGMLTDLVAEHEQHLSPQWSIDWSDERHHNLLKAIVGFEIEITRLEGKSKLNQNKTVEDQQGVIERLKKQGANAGMQVAKEMTLNLEKMGERE